MKFLVVITTVLFFLGIVTCTSSLSVVLEKDGEAPTLVNAEPATTASLNFQNLDTVKLYAKPNSHFEKVLFSTKGTYKYDVYDESLAQRIIEAKTHFDTVIDEKNESYANLLHKEIALSTKDMFILDLFFEAPESLALYQGWTDADFLAIANRSEELIAHDSESFDLKFWNNERKLFGKFYSSLLTFFRVADFTGDAKGFNQLVFLYKKITDVDLSSSVRIRLRHEPHQLFNEWDCPAESMELYHLFMERFEKYIHDHIEELANREDILKTPDMKDYEWKEEDHIWPIMFAAESFAKFIMLSPFDKHNWFIGLSLLNFSLSIARYPNISISVTDLPILEKSIKQYATGDPKVLYDFILDRVLETLNYFIKNV